MVPWFLQQENLLFLSPQTRGTIIMDNTGLKISLLETLSFIVTVIFFPWCKVEAFIVDHLKKIYTKFGEILMMQIYPV